MSDLTACSIWVREDRVGRLRAEYRLRREPNTVGRILSRAFIDTVLDDAAFAAAVCGPDNLITTCAQALATPAYPLSLGRREYPVTPPVLLKVLDHDDGLGALLACPPVARPSRHGPHTGAALARLRIGPRGAPGVHEDIGAVTLEYRRGVSQHSHPMY